MKVIEAHERRVASIRDDSAFEPFDETSEPGTYMLSMASYYRVEVLKEQAKKAFPKLDIPILLVGSKNDEVASFEASSALCKENKNCQLVELEKSNHVVLQDYDLEFAIREIMRFIKE